MIVKARNLQKSYGAFQAVKGIDFEIQKGQCFGFLGPNGAGKTTTMRMIYAASRVGSGTLEVFGKNLASTYDPYEFKRRVGVIPQEDNLDQELTTLDTMHVFCRFYGLSGTLMQQRSEELLRYVHLEDKRDSKVQQLSGGMRRRLQIARGLIGEPELLVLDEPTTGLDPQMRNQIWNHLKDLKSKSVTMILTTHYMHEAEQLCDDLVIMDLGKIVARGHPRELIAKHVPSHAVEVLFHNIDPQASWLSETRSSVAYSNRFTDRDVFYTDDSDALVKKILSLCPGVTVYVRHATLEDVFLRLTGRKLEDAAA